MTDRAVLVIMAGPPGSGKSTWVASRFPLRMFSLDMFRGMLTSGNPIDQDANAPARDMLHILVGYRMRRRFTTVVDSTNTRPEYRAPLIAAAREHGVPALAVVMATPLEVCLARNKSRGTDPGMVAAYPGANAAPVPPAEVARLAAEIRKTPPVVGEVDAVLTIGPDGPIRWAGDLPLPVLAEPWLSADDLDAPGIPRFAADLR